MKSTPTGRQKGQLHRFQNPRPLNLHVVASSIAPRASRQGCTSSSRPTPEPPAFMQSFCQQHTAGCFSVTQSRSLALFDQSGSWLPASRYAECTPTASGRGPITLRAAAQVRPSVCDGLMACGSGPQSENPHTLARQKGASG